MGSFQSASNPVLRDLTERVIVASKGRFDRAKPRRVREPLGLPALDTIYRDDFMDWTTDVWDIGTESATRVGHPAPFPVELPQRLIELYTYQDDLVLDPFMGSGSTAVAAVRTQRHYVGFDIDPAYVKTARERAASAVEDRDAELEARPWRVVSPSTTDPAPKGKDLARELLEGCGFRVEVPTRRSVGFKAAPGTEVTFIAHDRTGAAWWVEVCGSLTKGGDKVGLRRAETFWRTAGKASVIAQHDPSPTRRPLLVLTTDLPTRGSATGAALQTVRGADRPIFDAVEAFTAGGQERLRHYAEHGPTGGPVGEVLDRR